MRHRALALLILLPACQSGGDRARQLLATGAVRVEEAPAPGRGYDYAVTIRDEAGLGDGLGDGLSGRAEREALAGRAAGPTCAAPLVVREARVARAHTVWVRCRPA